jgi:hypothetical protein
LYFSPNIIIEPVWTDEIGGECDTNGKNGTASSAFGGRWNLKNLLGSQGKIILERILKRCDFR